MGALTAARRLARLVAGITEELGLIRPDADLIAADCATLADLLPDPCDRTALAALRTLAAAAAEADARAAAPVLALFAPRLPRLPRPLVLLAPLLSADDDDLAEQARGLVVEAAASGALPLDRDLLQALAGSQEEQHDQVDGDGEPSAADSPLARAAGMIAASPAGRAGLVDILVHDRDPRLRGLAARLLDSAGDPADPATAAAVLGTRAAAALAPYLAYSRAGCRDLLAIAAGGRRGSPPAAADLPAAAARHGEPLVRRLVAELGWERLNAGLAVRPAAEVVVPGQPPASFAPREADLLVGAGARRGESSLVIEAHGTAPAAGRSRGGARDPVQRFRRLNTNHADLLAVILDVAPLDDAKVRRIVTAMDRIVADYTVLFGDAGEECAVLPDVWDDLRTRALALLEAASAARALPAELTRLVMMFEDPPSVGAVRTIHGLKRFLHQKGLKRGFALVDAAESPNRTLDIGVVRRGGRLQRSATIRYAEFEAAAALGEGPAPFAVRLLADAWRRALLAGRTAFPDVNVFLFGNEVQYYLFFRNHPVFLRIDFSPPQRGGMLDLEYYGVSGYELDVHPSPGLEAIRRFFADLDCDVGQEGVRLQVRYDKERCRDLDDLIGHAAAVLRLAPWLMELDWLVGSLRLTAHARRVLIAAWSARFRDTGILPESALLTSDRLGVLCGVEAGPTGPVQSRWDGAEPYRDRFTGPGDPAVAGTLRDLGERIGLVLPPPAAGEAGGSPSLLGLERRGLDPLRAAAAAGLVRWQEGEAPTAADPAAIRPLHAAERFAQIVAKGGATAGHAAALAQPLAAVAGFVRFEPVGAVGGLAVSAAALPVLGGVLTIHALRDGHGRIRLGLVTAGAPLLQRRGAGGRRWNHDDGLDAAAVWALLRGANYVAGAPPPAVAEEAALWRSLRTEAAAAPAGAGAPAWEGALLPGLKAAPGRAVGRALLGSEGRRPEDAAGAVLVTPELGPGDNALMMRAAAVATTGGAVLSHAALLAIQYGKPALLVDARWSETPAGKPALRYVADTHVTEQRRVAGLDVEIRTLQGRRVATLADGDLVVVDANEGTLLVLGQDRDTLGLHDGLRQLGEAAARADRAAADGEVLAARALNLRAAHQVGRILDRLADPALAAFAVEDIVEDPRLAALPGSERARLLQRLLANPDAADAARAHLAAVAGRLAGRARGAAEAAREDLPAAALVAEVVGLRLRAVRAHRLHAACTAVLAGCGLECPHLPEPTDLDALAHRRLAELAADDRRAIGRPRADRPLPAAVRHRLRHLERCLDVASDPGRRPAALQARLAREDAARLEEAGGRLVVPMADCGFALQPLLGWKAANLGEMALLAGAPACPPFFVVTDRALQLMLEQPSRGGTLREAIAAVLAAQAGAPAACAAAIAALWREVSLPPAVDRAVAAAWADLAGPDSETAPVAVRSSSCDEDTETATRAGEFETFLNVQGAGAVTDHLRRAWAGLWGVRALAARAGDPSAAAWPRGGLIVQRLAESRVSGVVQTVNLARGDLGEMIINAGLGLGEGVVSGAAAADLVTVIKPRPGEPPGDLVFTYLTAEKPLQIVRDLRRGGTRRAETLYHQRLRPALEYVELCELVERCLALEAAYGYPLDIEFAIEGHTLWLLQARPVATILGELHETLARHPLAAPAAARKPTDPGESS